MTELGMTPAARSRVQVAEAGGDTSPTQIIRVIIGEVGPATASRPRAGVEPPRARRPPVSHSVRYTIAAPPRTELRNER